MRTIATGLFLIVLGVLLAIVGLAFMAGRVTAQDHAEGHLKYHPAYSTWKQPGTELSCCNAKETANGVTVGDCYPTAFRLTPSGWQAQRDTGDWIDIPDSRLLREPNPDPSGVTGHLCEGYGIVFCARPPTGAL